MGKTTTVGDVEVERYAGLFNKTRTELEPALSSVEGLCPYDRAYGRSDEGV